MSLLSFFSWLNSVVLSVPLIVIFFGIGIVLTIVTRFAQIRALPQFFSLILGGVKRKTSGNSIDSFHALFTAMATTMGMGNIVGPSLAIMVGGPGALFWLLVYIFFGSIIKFVEVTFAVSTRVKTAEGNIIGGPMQYLKEVSVSLAAWYNIGILFLLISWSSLQSNTLASILARECVPQWMTGVLLAIVAFVVLQGGAQRIGLFASRLVPIMFVLYISSVFFILIRDPHALYDAVLLVVRSVFNPAASIAGFMGATVFQAMRIGILRGILMTEAGVGTSAIPHSLADVQRPVDQGILAMCSMVCDAFLVTVSGLLALVTGVWMQGEFRSTLIYEAFLLHAPFFCRYILIASVALFVLTTVIGNSFNGLQSFNVLTRYRWRNYYIVMITIFIFCGALINVPLAWEISDSIMVFVTIPHLIGLLILAFKERKVLSL